jgi:hypothetical protein
MAGLAPKQFFASLASRPYTPGVMSSREVLVGAVSMDDHSHATDNAIDQTDQELLIFSVSDEALEKAAGGTTWAQTYPSTCVATMCVRDSPFPEMLSSQTTHAR